MGYLCPVCEEPFGGGEPLANHLAVTAILHGGDHEAWLDETVVDWDAISRGDLADRVVDHAETADDHDHPGEHSHVDVVSERSDIPDGVDADAVASDRTDSSGGMGASRGTGPSGGMSGSPSDSGPFSAVDTDALDPETQAILEEATAYTRVMAGEGDDESVDSDGEGKES
jgi:hypothetical protein